jgi:glutathione S-transferase
MTDRSDGAVPVPTLYYGPASYYAAKVAVAAAYCNVPVDLVFLRERMQDVLPRFNPLGKIPCWVTDEGVVIYDSVVIMQYLNQLSGNFLFPRDRAKTLEAMQLESLSDGIADCLLAHIYERRLRPAEIVYQPWLDRQWEKVTRGLDFLDANPPRLGRKLTGGTIAVRTLLDYAALRFEGQWEGGRPRLTHWMKSFDERFPELVSLLPH